MPSFIAVAQLLSQPMNFSAHTRMYMYVHDLTHKSHFSGDIITIEDGKY